MNDNAIFALKPIKFSALTHIGEAGSDLKTIDFFLSKLIVQNILYATYHKPSTIDEIADKLDVHASVLDELIDFLELNDFLAKLPKGKYITNILLHDLSNDVYQEMKNVYEKYAKVICEKYITKLFDVGDAFMRPVGSQEESSAIAPHIHGVGRGGDNTPPSPLIPNIYTPQNDLNFLMWTIVTFACCKKFDIPELNNILHKHFTKRHDGGEYITVASLEKEAKAKYDKDACKLSGQTILSGLKNDSFPSMWIYNSAYDDRLFDDIYGFHLEFSGIYYFLTSKESNADIINRLVEKKFLMPYSDVTHACSGRACLCPIPSSLRNNNDSINDLHEKFYPNMLVTNLNRDQLIDLLPNMPNDFIELNNQLSNEIFHICKSRYPQHLLDLCHDFYKKSITSHGMIEAILKQLLNTGRLMPLKNDQLQTVNMIMFCEFKDLSSEFRVKN